MKRIASLAVVSLLLIAMSLTAFAGKPVQKEEYTVEFDTDGDGIFDTVVIVEESLKQTKKSTTLSRTFFSEDYLDYLGMELIVNGEVIVDTFIFND